MKGENEEENEENVIFETRSFLDTCWNIFCDFLSCGFFEGVFVDN